MRTTNFGDWHLRTHEEGCVSLERSKIALTSLRHRAFLSLVRGDIFRFPFLTKVRYRVYESIFDLERPFHIGSNVLITNIHHVPNTSLSSKPYVNIMDNVYIDLSGSISIGKHVYISIGAKIFRHKHHIDRYYLSDERISTRDLSIDDEVWIGSSCIILSSVEKIGYGAIIGAGSVVTRNVEPFEIVAGNPASTMRKRDIKRRK